MSLLSVLIDWMQLNVFRMHQFLSYWPQTYYDFCEKLISDIKLQTLFLHVSIGRVHSRANQLERTDLHWQPGMHRPYRCKAPWDTAHPWWPELLSTGCTIQFERWMEINENKSIFINYVITFADRPLTTPSFRSATIIMETTPFTPSQKCHCQSSLSITMPVV